MAIDTATLHATASLAKLTVPDEPKMVAELNEIITRIDRIKELDVTDVPPAYNIVSRENVTREDVVVPSLSVKTITDLAPEAEYDHIVVPQILD